MTRYIMIVVLLSHASASAREFYVATSGSDANSGTIEQPFASVQRAQDSVEPGDTVFIRGGTYRIQESQVDHKERIWANVIWLNKSGRKGKPINQLLGL